jgi:hypothetical protein
MKISVDLESFSRLVGYACRDRREPYYFFEVVACKPSSTFFELSSECDSSCYPIIYDERPSQKFKVIHTWRTKPYLSLGKTVFHASDYSF